MRKVVITAAKRTPIGAFMGSLKDIPAVDLGVLTANAVMEGIPKAETNDVIIGNVLQAGQGMNPARQLAVKAGFPTHAPGQTINRVCGSGLQAIISAAQGIRAGDGDLFLAGGIENMSRAPFLLPYLRQGHRYGTTTIVDSMQADGLTDAFDNCAMGNSAETVARRWGISREEQDAYASESQAKTRIAIESGAFDAEIVPVTIKTGKAESLFAHDEHPRPGTSVETLRKLRPAFSEDGSVTAGNASGINDGAALLTVASEDKAAALGLAPIAEILSYSVIGIDPAIMGVAPSTAIPAAVARAGLKVEDIDLFEINEAFAVTTLATIDDLQIDPSRVNVHGGAIALGHPIGASGARALVTLIHALRSRKKSLGVASLCIGGGMGIAVLIRIVDGSNADFSCTA